MTESQWKERMQKLLTDYDPLRNLQLFEQLVTEDAPISNWDDFRRWFRPFGDRGCFRGHRDASWNLVTTLDRALRKTISVETKEIHSTVVEKMNPAENERTVLLEFQRGAHHYHAGMPAADNLIDWLTVTQHYGAPTRLLDWTRSPYVALYFAMQGDSEADAALWAIDLTWLEKRSNELLRQKDTDCPQMGNFHVAYDYLNRKLFREDNPHVIISASPLQSNHRMLVQQGQLLCSLRHDVAFSTTLLGMLIHPSVIERQSSVRSLSREASESTFLKNCTE